MFVKRSVLSFVLCLALLINMVPTSAAETFTVSSGTIGEVEYILDSDGIFTLRGFGTTGDFSNANQLPYYDYMGQIKTVIVEAGVTTLGDRLFYGASNLTSVTIANSVTDIGEACFRQCTSLKSVVLPDSVKNLTRVAFYKCTALEEIDLGGVETIGDKVFTGCAELVALTIPSSLTTLEADNNGVKSDAFAGIASAGVSVVFEGSTAQWETLLTTYPSSVLTNENVTVACVGNTGILDSGTTGDVSYTLTSNGVLTLSGNGATADYDSKTGQPYHAYKKYIKKVVVEDGVTHLGTRLFYEGVTNLEEVEIADSVSSIGEACFRGCTSLKSIVLPSGLDTLSRVGFYGCTSLQEVVLAGTYSQLSDKIFVGCANILKITIPVTITTLADTKGTDAFEGIMAEDVSVLYDGTVAQWETLLQTYPDSALAQSNVTVTCADGVYNSATGGITILSEGTTGEVSYVLTTDGVLTFSGNGATADYASATGQPFNDYKTQIKRVIVEEGVTHLGARLFYGATSMEEISIASTVASVGEACFRQCSSLKKIILPDAMNTLSRVAFYSCTELEEVDLGQSVMALGDKIFTGCSEVTRLIIPATLTTLAASNNGTQSDAFAGISTNTVSVTYGGTVAQWKVLLSTYDSVLGKDYVVVTCTDGTYSSAEDEVMLLCAGSIGDVTYTLTSDGLFTLSGFGATANHSNATGSNPAPWASYLSQIKTLIVEEGVTMIGNNLFRDAVNLQTVSLSNTVTTIGEACFRDCTSLTSVTLPESLTTLKRVAFYGCTALEEITIAGSYTQLSDKIFVNCAKLRKITIPVTIISLESNKETDAFAGISPDWKNPVTVTYSGTVMQWKSMLEDYSSSILGAEYVTVVCSDGIYIHNPVDPSISHGTVGQVYWKYDSTTKTLTIGGNGETPVDYSNIGGLNPVPWAAYIAEIESVVIEEGVTLLGQNLFRDARSLLNVSLPNTLKSVGQATFRDCDSLISITIPDSVEDLARTAFYDCDMLREAILGGTYTYLTDKLFQKCINLRSITLPGTVNYIDSNAFGGCAQINAIYFDGTRAQWYSVLTHSKSLGAAAIKKDYIQVYCTDGLYIDGFTSIENGLVYKIVDDVLIVMGNGTIADYSSGNAPWSGSGDSITTVILYSGVTGVGKNAFADCAHLNVAAYQGNVEVLKTNIEDGNEKLISAFDNAMLSGSCGTNVTWSLDVSSGIMTIKGTGAISDYESRKETPWTNYANLVTELVIEDGVSRIGEYAFNSFRNLETLRLPTSLEILDTYCFGICPSLTTLTIPEGVRIIASKVFNTCSGITTIYLPSTLEFVDMKAFEGATSITDVYYNGSRMDWNAITISSNCLGNKYLTEAQLHTAVDMPVYTDISTEAWYAGDVQFLLDNCLAEVPGEIFGVDETDNLDIVVVALYNRAKIQYSYEDALCWAIDCGIISETSSNELTLQTLAQLLFRAACYNVYSEALLQDVEKADVALDWCKDCGFTNVLMQNVPDLTDDTVLTRGQVCSVLAAFLKNSAGTVNRYERIIGTVRAALASGGDGKLYILPLDITDHNSSSESGDCTFVLFPNGETMLIDAFSSWGSEKLLTLLDAIGLRNLDHMVLSHAHADHIGNCQDVVNWIYDSGGTIGHYWSAGYIYPASTEDDLITLLQEKCVPMNINVRQGDQIIVGDVVIDVYHPTQAALDELTAGGNFGNEYINNISMVMKFTYGTSTFLTCGDLHSNQENQLVATFGQGLHADVMKSNHHGTYTSNGADWMNAVDPQTVFTHASDLGEATFYENCLSRGCDYYTVGKNGLILIAINNSANYEVLSQYGAKSIGNG